MEGEPLTTLADWLTYLRRKALWEQVDLAAASNVSAEAISHIERGVVQAQRGTGYGPRKGTRATLADRFDVLVTDDDTRMLPEEAADLKAQARHVLTAPAGPVTPRSSTIPTNLPAQLTSFLGRKAELARIAGFLRPAKTRLLTLTGPGGVGKTRLAVEAAAALRELYTHGVYLVELAPVTDVALLLPTIARTLGLSSTSSQPLQEQLIEYLRPKKLLLVLDNFEHLLTAAPEITAILAACSRLTVVATSRTGLGVRGEQRLPILPLAVPDPQTLPTLALLARFGAIALFEDRARMVAPDFRLVANTAPATTAICQRLDGLPLAIELAAARVGAVPLHALLDQLSQRLEAVGGDLQDLPARQQNLYSTIAWSYNLLPSAARVLFRHLSVFAGGCSLASIQATGNQEEDGDGSLHQSLAALVSHSLLRTDGTTDSGADASQSSSDMMAEQGAGKGQEPRFTMLETLRAFAREQASKHGEWDALRQRHAEHYLNMAEEAEPQLLGANQKLWLARLRAEHTNVQQALAWLHAQGQMRDIMRYIGALWRFWQEPAYLPEGRLWCARVLSTLSTFVPLDAPGMQVRARALVGAGMLAQVQGDYMQAQAWNTEGRTLFEQCGDQVGQRRAIHNLGTVALKQGNYAQARAYLEEVRHLYHSAEDSVGLARTLGSLAIVVEYLGDYDAAESAYRQSIEINTRQGNVRGTSATLGNLGALMYQRGRWQDALQYLEQAQLLREGIDAGTASLLSNLALCYYQAGDLDRARRTENTSLTVFRKEGNKEGITIALKVLGDIAHAQGKDDEALEHYQQALLLGVAIDAKIHVVETAVGLAQLRHDQGDAEQALQLFAWATELRIKIESPLPPVDQPTYDKLVSSLCASLGSAAWTEARAVAQLMTTESLIQHISMEGATSLHAAG